MSIRLRLTLWYSGILAITLLIFGSALYFFLWKTNDNTQRSNLKALSTQIISQMTLRPSVNIFGNVKISLQLPPLDEYRFSSYYVQVFDSSERFYQASNVQFPYRAGTFEKIKGMTSSQYEFQTYRDSRHQLLILSRPLVASVNPNETNFAGMLQVAVLQDDLNNLLHQLLSVLVLLTIVVILIGLSLGLFLARKALQPIERVITATESIEKGDDLAKRIEYDGPPDEIGRLTQKINSMLERLQGAYMELEGTYRTQRRFVSDASHELRTPLTTIRGNVDLLEKMWTAENEKALALSNSEKMEVSREAMKDIASEAARMSRLVGDLLSLARADAGVEMTKTIVPIAPIVQQVVRGAGLLPKSVDWRVGGLSELDGVQVYGNGDYLQQLLFIFIENAFKYTEHGHVQIDALRVGDQIGIKISDTGIGMDKEEVPLIFDRFYRTDPSRGKKAGTGLGLSIAKWIIDEHNGSIEVITRKDEGSTFIIWLPLYQQPGALDT